MSKYRIKINAEKKRKMALKDYKKFFGWDAAKHEVESSWVEPGEEITDAMQEMMATISWAKKKGLKISPESIKELSSAMKAEQAALEAKAAQDVLATKGLNLQELSKLYNSVMQVTAAGLNTHAIFPVSSYSVPYGMSTDALKSLSEPKLVECESCLTDFQLISECEIFIEDMWLCNIKICNQCVNHFDADKDDLVKLLKINGVIES